MHLDYRLQYLDLSMVLLYYTHYYTLTMTWVLVLDLPACFVFSLYILSPCEQTLYLHMHPASA